MKKILASFMVAAFLASALPVFAMANLNPDGTLQQKAPVKKKTTTPKKKAAPKTTKKKTTTPKKKTTTKKKTAPKKKATPKPKVTDTTKADQQQPTSPISGTDTTSVEVTTPDGVTQTTPVYDNGDVTPPQPDDQKINQSSPGKPVAIAGLAGGGALALLALIRKFFWH